MADQQYPEPTVGALIFNPEGKVLLVRSHKWNDNYVIPGGHVEVGEKLEDAVKREVKEETGLDVYDITLLLPQEFIFGAEFWKKKHFLFFDYACRTTTSRVTLNGEGQEYVWATLEEATNLPIDPYTRRTIETYHARNNDITRIQQRILNFAEQRMKEKNISPSVELTYIHLIEELGEVARQVTNKKLRPDLFDKENLKEEVVDVLLEALVLAHECDVDLEKDITRKLDALYKRHGFSEQTS